MQLMEIITSLTLQMLSGNELANDVTCDYICDSYSDVLSESRKLRSGSANKRTMERSPTNCAHQDSVGW